MVEKSLKIKQFFTQNSLKPKVEIIKEFGCILGIVGKNLWWVGFNERDLNFFTSEVHEIFNFE